MRPHRRTLFATCAQANNEDMLLLGGAALELYEEGGEKGGGGRSISVLNTFQSNCT